MLKDILLTILILDGIALTGIILLQRSEGGGLVSGGGGGQFMTARGTANLLTRATEILVGVFFVLSLTITILIGRTSGTGSVVDKVTVQSLSPEAMAKQQEAQRQAAEAAAKAAAAQNQGGIPGLPGSGLAPVPGAPAAPGQASPFGAAPAAPGR